MSEEFRIFQEYPAYKVSSLGYMVRIKPGRGTWVGKITRGARRNDGYLQVFGFGHFYGMAQVVAHVFLGPCPPGYQVNHKNRIKDDNRIENLEYTTQLENIRHMWSIMHEEEKQQRAHTSRINGSKSEGNPFHGPDGRFIWPYR